MRWRQIITARLRRGTRARCSSRATVILDDGRTVSVETWGQQTWRWWHTLIAWWRYPRGLHRLIASLGEYFWLGCPLCARMFGGHEWLPYHTLWLNRRDGQAVCPWCWQEAQRLNRLLETSQPVTIAYDRRTGQQLRRIDR